MWRTAEGSRVLTGNEGNLFRVGAAFLSGSVVGIHAVLEHMPSLDSPSGYDVEVFDVLSWGQKLAMIEQVAAALLKEDVPEPELTAVNEGTIAAIYEFIRRMVNQEISDRTCELRPLVLAAARERDVAETYPRAGSRNCHRWFDLIDALRMQILWDDDWDMGGMVADLPPDEAWAMKQAARIDENYYAAIAPDPSDAEVEEIRHRLNAVLAE